MIPKSDDGHCIVHATPHEARQRLSEMGLTYGIFVDAAQQGFVERLNSSPFDPKTKSGFDAWSYPIRSLRQSLDELGFRIDDPRNWPLSISDEIGVAITVSSGDDLTGVVGAKRLPRSKNPKGSLLSAAIERNVGQSDMFAELLPESVQKYAQTLEYPIWVLLLHMTDDYIRAELSRPSSLDDGDYIIGWSERIIIEVPLPGDESASVDDSDSGPDIVPIVVSKI